MQERDNPAMSESNVIEDFAKWMKIYETLVCIPGNSPIMTHANNDFGINRIWVEYGNEYQALMPLEKYGVIHNEDTGLYEAKVDKYDT
jgi:hypothetical protein